MIGGRVRLAAAVLMLATGCAGRGVAVADGGASPRANLRCETAFTTPAGFDPTETFEDPYADHVGVRLGYRDGEGRELHVFAGIPGELGEGLPSAGEVPVAGGGSGRLLGTGSVWVLAWETSGPCAAHAVLGNGFTRQEFLRILTESGVVPT